jgi:hypothetical protein
MPYPYDLQQTNSTVTNHNVLTPENLTAAFLVAATPAIAEEAHRRAFPVLAKLAQTIHTYFQGAKVTPPKAIKLLKGKNSLAEETEELINEITRDISDYTNQYESNQLTAKDYVKALDSVEQTIRENANIFTPDQLPLLYRQLSDKRDEVSNRETGKFEQELNILHNSYAYSDTPISPAQYRQGLNAIGARIEDNKDSNVFNDHNATSLQTKFDKLAADLSQETMDSTLMHLRNLENDHSTQPSPTGPYREPLLNDHQYYNELGKELQKVKDFVKDGVIFEER